MTGRGAYRLRVPDDVVALISSLHPVIKKKVKAALRKIVTEPYEGKALRDDLEGFYSFRVNRIRIIYRPSRERIIEVIAIGPRKVIYEMTYLLIQRQKGQG